MNLAKALKTKSRLVNKIATLQTDIQHHNSISSEQERKINVTTMMADLEDAVQYLIKLKLTIFIASTPMRETILKLAETKSRIAFLRGIDIHEGKGKESDNYRFGNNEDTAYVVEFDIVWVRTATASCETLIDTLQDNLDTFNHKTEIEV